MSPFEVIELFRNENENAKYALNPDGSSNTECKWYSFDEEFREFSNKFPDFLFKLSGEGEDSDDRWTRYYLGGKCHFAKAKIVIEDFDESKLV